MFDTVITIIAVIGIVYLIISKNKPKKRDCVQDLFDYKEIHGDGLVELPGNRFRKIIEVQPINMSIRSQREQSIIWENFRTMVNSMVFPLTFLVQNTHLDVVDYTQYVEEKIEETNNQIIKECGRDYINHIYNLTENKTVKAQRHYIICKIDVTADTVDSGVEVEDNTVAIAINALLKVANRPPKLDEAEALTLARSELDNTANVIGSYLSQMGIIYNILDKEGVVDMVYSTLNRDIGNVIRTKEVSALEAFSLFTTSATPHLHGSILKEEEGVQVAI